MADKMPALMIALGKAGAKKAPADSSPDMGDEDEESEGEVSEEAVSAASEFADAIKGGDGKLIAMAFKNLMKEC